MVAFNLIPIDVRVPGAYIEIDPSAAFRGLTGFPAQILVIGQRLTAGSKPELEPHLITDKTLADDYFGKGSQLALMCAALLAAMPGPGIPVYAIAQDDADGSSAAAGDITFGGAATAAGVLNLYISGKRLKIAVASGDDGSDIATAVAAAINADAHLPVTAEVDGETAEQVNITAKNKGAEANNIDIRVNYYSDETLPPGVTAAVTALSAGAGNPDIGDVFAVIGDTWYTDLAVAYTDASNLTALKAQLETNFGPMLKNPAHAYVGFDKSHANLITEGGNHNSPHLTAVGTNDAPHAPYEWAAALTAVCAFYAKQDPARQFRGLRLPGLLAPKADKLFTQDERDLLLRGGITTWLADRDGTIRLERVITTYRENSVGAPDPAYLDLPTVKTVTFLRFDTVTLIGLRYPNWKLADDGTNFARGSKVATPNTIRGTLIARFQQWEEAGLVEDIEQFKADLIVERDANDPNRVNALIPPNIVNNLMVFAGVLQFRL